MRPKSWRSWSALPGISVWRSNKCTFLHYFFKCHFMLNLFLFILHIKKIIIFRRTTSGSHSSHSRMALVSSHALLEISWRFLHLTYLGVSIIWIRISPLVPGNCILTGIADVWALIAREQAFIILAVTWFLKVAFAHSVDLWALANDSWKFVSGYNLRHRILKMGIVSCMIVSKPTWQSGSQTTSLVILRSAILVVRLSDIWTLGNLSSSFFINCNWRFEFCCFLATLFAVVVFSMIFL